MALSRAAAKQAMPATFVAMQDVLYPTYESLITSARHLAAGMGVTLTITHKSRNTPMKEQAQYRGCLVLSCYNHLDGCTFEIKAYGPLEGGWSMRPLYDADSPRIAVTSWCECNHVPLPLRVEPKRTVTSWNELLEIPFACPDDLIYTATHFARSNSTSVNLLALMISDGKPKPNGRNTTYTPRGFLSLECAEAGNGCPMVIKGREEEDGWFMRPWKEKGKGADVKGASSIIICNHGQQAKHLFLLKQEEKEEKARLKNPKGKKPLPDALPDAPDPTLAGLPLKKARKPYTRKAPLPLPSPPLHPATGAGQVVLLPQHSLHDQSMAIAQAQTGAFDTQTIIAQHLLAQHAQNAHNNNNNNHNLDNGPPYPNDYQSHAYADHFPAPPPQARAAPHASTSAEMIYDRAPPFVPVERERDYDVGDESSSSSPAADASIVGGSGKKRGINKPESSSSKTRPPKRVRHRGVIGGISVLKASWKSFLVGLDPKGRLAGLQSPLVRGGIDPGAVVEWPEKDVGDFVESLAGEVPVGVRVHFKVLLMGQGKRVWGEMQDKED